MMGMHRYLRKNGDCWNYFGIASLPEICHLIYDVSLTVVCVTAVTHQLKVSVSTLAGIPHPAQLPQPCAGGEGP